LLAADPSHQHLLLRTLGVPLTDRTPEQTDRHEKIGPYKLLELLGEGGMGEVWLAEQSVPVHRRVALKVIKAGMDTKQVLARLEAERQALAVMDHPNIAKFFDGGATETGRPYFVMELVQGVPITRYCDDNRLSTDERLRLFVDVCNAVQHAHHKGVIHRDLKPSNVLVAVKDSKPVVKIIDFGIAKALGQDLTERTLVTRMGQIVGTPEYMSPEQAEMSGMDVDTRTDVFSLGVMLYELLVGALPFDFTARADEAIRHAIRETEIPKPSNRLTNLGDTQTTVAQYRRTTPEALRKELRSDLDWIILKAMEKDRTRRYDTANGLAAELERHLRNEPVLAHAPSLAYRLRKFARRHRAGVGFATAFTLVVLFSVVGLSIQAVRIARERDRAEREAAKAQAVNDFMTRTLLAPDPVNGLGADATILEALDAAVARLQGRYASEPEVDAAVRSSIGWAYFNLSRYDDAEPLLQEALRIREEISDGETADVAQSLHQLASFFDSKAQSDSAESLFRRALDMRRRTLPPNDGRIAETLIRYAGLLISQGRFEEAEGNLEQAVRILERGDADPLQISAANSRLGQLYWTQGNYEAAEPLLRRTLAERREHLEPDHPLVGEALNNLAVFLEDQGRWEEAEVLYREALSSLEGAFGEASDHVSSVLGNLALILSQRGETVEADSLFRRALAMDLELLGPDHPTVGVDKLNLGVLLCDAEQAPEGLALTSDAVRILGAVLEPGQWEMGAARSAQGHCLGRTGRYAEGERELLAALQIVEAALGPDHPRNDRIRFRLVELYEAWGRPEEAARYRTGLGKPQPREGALT
jgi:serine/threonine protein kinase/tetratricopeptide (TPR) repeat protein